MPLKVARKLLIALVIIFVLLSQPYLAFAAETISDLFGVNDVELYDKDATEELSENATYAEQSASSILIGPVNWVRKALHIKDIVTLIYGVDVDYSDTYYTNEGESLYRYINQIIISKNGGEKTDDYINSHNLPLTIEYEGKSYKVVEAKETFLIGRNKYKVQEIISSQAINGDVFGIFPKELFPLFSLVKNKIQGIIIILLALSICVSGVLLLLKTTSTGIQFAKSLAAGITIALLLLKFQYTLFQLISDINNLGVKFFYSLLGTTGNLSFLEMLWQPETKSLGMAIVVFLSIFMIASMNFQYACRMLILGVLYIMGPIVALVSIFPSRKEVLNMWTNETCGNVLTQLAHSVVLTIFIGMIYGANSIPFLKPYSFWFAMAGLMSLTPLTTIVRNMLGLATLSSRSAAGFAGNMLGIGALLGTARIATALAGRRNSKKAGASVHENMITNSSDNSTGSTGASTTSPRSHTPGADMVRSGIKRGLIGAASIGGALTASMAGGMVMGAAGQDATAGIVLGGMAGSRLGNVAGKGAAYSLNRGNALRRTLSNGKGLKQNISDSAGFYDTSQLTDVEQMIAMGGSLGSAVTGSQAGQKMGEVVGSGIARVNRLSGKRSEEKIESRANIYDRSNLLNTKDGRKAINNNTSIEFSSYMDNLRKQESSLKENAAESKLQFESLKSYAESAKLKFGAKSDEYNEARQKSLIHKANYEETVAMSKEKTLELLRMKDKENAQKKVNELREKISGTYIRTGSLSGKMQ